MPPPLIPLHADTTLSPAKLVSYNQLTTEVLIDSLRPGLARALKTRPDGTIIDGHHRIKLLRERGVDVTALPREIIPKDVDDRTTN